jgi:hypothetical protein
MWRFLHFLPVDMEGMYQFFKNFNYLRGKL